MKDNSWQDCIENNSCLKISADQAKARSLLDIAYQRISFVKKIKPDEENINFLFENYYSSVLEHLHALLLTNGFTVKNHICLGYYLRDIMKNERLFRMFENCRFSRNVIVYYGTTMSFEKAAKSIRDCEFLMKEIKTAIGKLKTIFPRI